MADAFIGEVRAFGFGFAPQNWAVCAGQILAIASNTALFALIGTTYGGNGTTNFALPDLRGRVPVHQGQGPGLTDRVLGEVGGSESVTLISSQLPMHNHLVKAAAASDTANAGNDFPGTDTRAPLSNYNTTTDGSVMNPASVAPSGGNLPHNNLQPYLAINFCICLYGIFPSRN